MLQRIRQAVLCAAGAVLFSGVAMAGDGYNPLLISQEPQVEMVDLTVTDAGRDRDIPIRVYLPAETQPAAVILFSHGLGGSCRNNPYLGRHWSGRGYAVVFVQHPGSDEAVWQDKPAGERLAALTKAASLSNFLLRAQDIPAVLNALQRWQDEAGHALQGRLDLTRVGMSGHSFGAITTQAVSGQRMLTGTAAFTDPRIDAAVMMSPSSPAAGSAQRAFGSVRIPWMLMTGTKDVSFIGEADAASRLAVFAALPPGNKYELVLNNAEHSAFNESPLPGDIETRNPNHHRAVLALSTAFWDAYLRDDPAAKDWLDGPRPQTVLEENDRWQIK